MDGRKSKSIFFIHPSLSAMSKWACRCCCVRSVVDVVVVAAAGVEFRRVKSPHARLALWLHRSGRKSICFGLGS